ncbi:cytochrome C oxidase subunit IV family protein [Flavobacterium aestuarii]|uniref:cytochrome C oxidase subunit IV family protein n=1 Tax=Flavobacterium aestuarii TaxID=3149227 RepID=UPI0032B59A7B
MKNLLNLVLILLIILTIATAYVSEWSVLSGFAVPFLVLLSSIKFLLVAFQFMELKKAHTFWKMSLLITLGLLVILIVSLK